MGLVVTLFISRAGLPYAYDIGSILKGDLECFFYSPEIGSSYGWHMKSSSESFLISRTPCGAHHQGPFHWCSPSCIPGRGQEVEC